MHLHRYRFHAADAAGGSAAGEGKGDEGADAGKGQTPDELAALRAELAALRAAEAKRAEDAKRAAEAEAAKRGEHEQLATRLQAERDELAAKVKAAEEREAARLARIETANKAAVAKIPEDRRSLVPRGLGGDDLAEWLDANKALLFGADAFPAGTTSRGRPADEIPDSEITDAIRKDAQVRGLDPRAWLKILKSARPARA